MILSKPALAAMAGLAMWGATETFTDVKVNAPVADDVFAKPAPKL